MKQALIIGGDSRLGDALRQVLEVHGQKVVATTRRSGSHSSRYYLADYDLLRPQLPAAYTQDWDVYVVAAITGFGACERSGDSWRVNADAPGLIARQVAGPVLFVSSDAVEFAPHTAYAMQKAHAELAVLAAWGSVLRCGPMSAEGAYESAALALADLAGAPRGTLSRWSA